MHTLEGTQGGSSSWISVSRVSGSVFLVAGLVLLAIALVGEYTSLGQLKNAEPKSWDRLDAELVARTPDLESLIAEAHGRVESADQTTVPAGELMKYLYQVTTERFVHGAAEHTLLSNWIIWARGTTRSHPVRIADSGELLKRGYTGLCGQVSQVLVDIARLSGIEARLVDMDDHVVMEAFHDEGWHMYDVDAEVGPNGSQSSLPSLETLSGDPARLEALYADNNPGMIPLLLGAKGHDYVSNLNAPRLRFERMAETAKFVLPISSILLGSWLLWPGRPRKAS